MIAISDALAEGIGADTHHGTLPCKLSLELQSIESVAAAIAIGSRTALVIKLPRKGPPRAEDILCSRDYVAQQRGSSYSGGMVRERARPGIERGQGH